MRLPLSAATVGCKDFRIGGPKRGVHEEDEAWQGRHAAGRHQQHAALDVEATTTLMQSPVPAKRPIQSWGDASKRNIYLVYYALLDYGETDRCQVGSGTTAAIDDMIYMSTYSRGPTVLDVTDPGASA